MDVVTTAATLASMPSVRIGIELLQQFIISEMNVAAKNDTPAMQALLKELTAAIPKFTEAVLSNTDKAYEPQPNTTHSAVAAATIADVHAAITPSPSDTIVSN